MRTIELIGTDGKERKYTLPASYAECSVAQLGAVAALTSVSQPTNATPAQKEYNEAHLRLQLFRHVAGIPDAEFAALEPGDLLGLRTDELNVDRVAFLPWLDWALAPPLFHQSVVPHVNVGKKRFLGPQDKLAGWSVNQWIFADGLLGALATSGEVKDLDNLLGALYRPDDRKWKNKDLEKYAAELAALDDRTKLAAVLNYKGLRAWLAAKYPKAFKGGKPDVHGPRGMLVRLAGNKFGTVKQVPNEDLHSVLVHAEQCIMDQEEAEQNARRN